MYEVKDLIPCADIIMVKQTTPTHSFGDKPWLAFEHVTMTPICRRLVEPSLLTPGEIRWLNEYHVEIVEKTKDFFQGDSENAKRTLKWLERETAPF